MTTFTTTIKSMHTMPILDGQENVVVTLQYEITGTNGNHKISIENSNQITLNKSSEFIPYEQLTEAQVINWIPVKAIASCKAYIENQIQSMITPPESPVFQNLPWATFS